MNKIFVIGIGYKPLDGRAREIIVRSDLILASHRLFDLFKGYGEFEEVKDRVTVINNVEETLAFMKSQFAAQQSAGAAPRNIALLASGDPLFFGIGRRAAEEFGKENVEILPDLSCIQLAFARIKEPWDNAKLISLHGGPDPEKRRRLEFTLQDLPGLLERHGKVAVLTDRTYNPSVIAKELSPFASQQAAIGGQRSVRIFVCEKLGYADEKVTEGTPEEISPMTFSDPNVVIIQRSAVGIQQEAQHSPAALMRFGLRENEIVHSRGLITKDEIRAVTLHKLRLPERGVFWDIGAGSGSLSIEAARLSPGLRVYAVEKDEEQIHNIGANMDIFNTRSVEIVSGTAPEALQGMPVPDRVFIGGSGGRLREIVDLISRTMPTGIIVVNATTIETLSEAVAALETSRFDLQVSEVSVSRSKTVGGKKHMSAMNPVFIITGERTEE